jgi:hypothetical protein
VGQVYRLMGDVVIAAQHEMPQKTASTTGC